MNEQIEQSKKLIQSHLDGKTPKLAVTLGSGLGDLVKSLENSIIIKYDDLPGFPLPTVEGHAGEMHIGSLNGVDIIFLKGRVHLYEGYDRAENLKVMIRTLKSVGIETLFLTNAAGSLNIDNGPGSLVMITDHINFTGFNPLVGKNDDNWGPRFPSLDLCWNPDLRNMLEHAAGDIKFDLKQGVFGGWLGPCFETHAEIKMLKILGCDTVGMSIVAENIVARHCGLECVGVSSVTNLAAGLSDEILSHAGTLHWAEKNAENLSNLIKAFVKRYSDAGGIEAIKAAA